MAKSISISLFILILTTLFSCKTSVSRDIDSSWDENGTIMKMNGRQTMVLYGENLSSVASKGYFDEPPQRIDWIKNNSSYDVEIHYESDDETNSYFEISSESTPEKIRYTSLTNSIKVHDIKGKSSYSAFYAIDPSGKEMLIEINLTYNWNLDRVMISERSSIIPPTQALYNLRYLEHSEQQKQY